MSSLLFSTGVAGPATFAGVVTVLAPIAMLTGRARRALSVDPIFALRHE
jgi:hypothetical protein